MDTLRYHYRPKTWVMALAGLFFLSCAVILVKAARENDRGMIINGIITLDRGDATTFLWILVGVSGLFVVAGVYGVVRSLGTAQEIVIDRTAITAPKGGLSSKIRTVPFSTVTDLQIQRVNSQHFLTIHHRDGKLTIARSMMPRREDFDELVAIVASRCRM